MNYINFILKIKTILHFKSNFTLLEHSIMKAIFLFKI